MEEAWRDVVGFEDYFSISPCGKVLSKRTGKILKQGVLKNGYKVITTRIGGRNGQCYCLRVHRMVAKAFLPAPSEDLVRACAAKGYGNVIVRHLDNNKTNNSVDNLAWGTYQDNTNDFKESASYQDFCNMNRGVKSSNSLFTQEEVDSIRAIYIPKCKTNGCRTLAKKFNVHHSSISAIINSKSY